MTQARNLTAVQLVYRKKRINHRLRFGIPLIEARLDWRRKLVAFAPGSVLGYIRWRANRFGTQDWRLFVLRTVENDPFSTVPGVMPGANILLATRGTTRTQRALAHLDTLELGEGGLSHVTDAYWRHLHNRLAVSLDPHGFSALQASTFRGDVS
ncbi:DUF2840 domain-containing protein [Parasphingorhabdus sp. DH2-15]|uniref:DUF2840 domain-containing protein n=1 Tax=Parasphingorhabdus sp. DH2-15 TaxID=3444112 RepID=UPI003F68953D